MAANFNIGARIEQLTRLLVNGGLPYNVARNTARITARQEYRNYIQQIIPTAPWMKKGGRAKKTGLYKLHKGEVIVPSHRVKTVDKALKKSKCKPLKKKY